AQMQDWSAVPHGTPLFESAITFDTAESLALPLVLALAGSEMRLHYDASRFDDATATRILGHFQTLLEGSVADPQTSGAGWPPLTAAERRQIVYEWNDIRADFPADKCIFQLVEEQVARSPDAVAVIFEGKEFSYRHINARANQLAHYLRGL